MRVKSSFADMTARLMVLGTDSIDQPFPHVNTQHKFLCINSKMQFTTYMLIMSRGRKKGTIHTGKNHLIPINVMFWFN